MRTVVFLLVSLVVCAACRTTEKVYIPVETVNTEYRNVLQRDSVRIHDSVFVTVKGDTVFRDRWHTAFRDRWRNDTVLKADSIPVPYPVERRLSAWEQMKLHYGGYSLAVVFVSILMVFGRFVYRLKKKV